MTIRNLADRAERSVSEIVEYAMRNRRSRATEQSAPKRAAKAKAAAPAAGSVDTRSEKGRSVYQEAVASFVAKAGRALSAVEIREF